MTDASQTLMSACDRRIGARSRDGRQSGRDRGYARRVPPRAHPLPGPHGARGGSCPDAGILGLDETFQLVHTLVVADLAQQVSDRVVLAVLGSVGTRI